MTSCGSVLRLAVQTRYNVGIAQPVLVTVTGTVGQQPEEGTTVHGTDSGTDTLGIILSVSTVHGQAT